MWAAPVSSRGEGQASRDMARNGTQHRVQVVIDLGLTDPLMEELDIAAADGPAGDDTATGPPDTQAGPRRRLGVSQAAGEDAASPAAASTGAAASAACASGRLGGPMGTALRRQRRQRSTSCAPAARQAGRSELPAEEAAAGQASSCSATDVATALPVAAAPLGAATAPGSAAAADSPGPAVVPRRPDGPPPPQRAGMRGRRGLQQAR
mmetsp:Transcript_46518/g.148482  ORF Transcript_46518/g.148482 Transcript_46518/m.148482 type:complete len:208 (-) Transcript_46518:139-762(-)